MRIDKRLLIVAIAIVMAIGVTPTFAAEQTTGDSGASVDVQNTIYILVAGDVSWTDLFADNIPTDAQQTTVTSKSNIPINVTVIGTEFGTTGNYLPMSALQFKNSTSEYATMSSSSAKQALGDVAVPAVGGQTDKSMDLRVQVPYGVSADTYTSTLTWTASAA